MIIYLGSWSRGNWNKIVLVHKARRGTWGLGRYYNLRVVLCFANTTFIPIYIEIGTSDRRNCIDLRNVVSEIREEVYEVCLAPSYPSFVYRKWLYERFLRNW